MHDPYAGVAPTWDADAVRVYGPIAADLVAAAPHPLAGHVVLDASTPPTSGSSARRTSSPTGSARRTADRG